MVIKFYLHGYGRFIHSFDLFLIYLDKLESYMYFQLRVFSWFIDERDLRRKKNNNDNNKAIQKQKGLLTSLLSIVDLVVSKIQ